MFDWNLFEESVDIAVRYLNLTINATSFTTQKDIELYNRKVLRPIGLGLTGYATCLVNLKIEYCESANFCYKLCSTLLARAVETSMDLAHHYPDIAAKGWQGSRWQEGLLPIDLWTSNNSLNKYSSVIKNDATIEKRLSNLRSMMTKRPLANLNLIAHMPTLRRALTKNMSLGFTPLHSLITEVGLENNRVVHYTPGLHPDHYNSILKRHGKWYPKLPSYYKTSDQMDIVKILNIIYIAQLYCDMAISFTPHFRDNKILTIHNYISNAYNLKTPLYYLRLDISAFDPLNDDGKCVGGMCSV